MNFSLRSLCAAAIAAVCSASAFGQNTAVTIVPNANDTFNNGNGYSLGYQFTVGNTPIDVTSLGYFDYGTLSESHEVGIFNLAGTLLLSGNVVPGDSTANYFAYTMSFTGSPALAANTTYEIMGASGVVDPYSFVPTSFSTDPDITFVKDEQVSGNTLAFGSTTDGIVGFFGPNFTFGSAAPEPFSVGLLGLSVFGLAARRRRTKAVKGK